MARRADGSYDFGDADMDNPVFQQRRSMADAALRSGSSNPYPGFQSVGVTGSAEPTFEAISNTELPGFQVHERSRSDSPSPAGLLAFLLLGIELFVYYELGHKGFILVNILFAVCIFLRKARASLKVWVGVAAVALMLFGGSYAYFKLVREPRNRVQAEEYRRWREAQALDYQRTMDEASRRGNAGRLASCNAYAASHHGAKMPIQFPGQHACP